MRFRKPLARTLFFVFIIACLLTGLAGVLRVPVNAAPQRQAVSSVVISEFRFLGPAGGNDEFIELYNPTDLPIDIGGWLIRGSNNAGFVSTRATIPSPTSLQPGQYYLVVNNSSNGYSGSTSPDLTYTNSITDDGGVALTLSDGITVVDAVGLSAGSAYKEGTPLSPLSGSANQSYERTTAGGGNCNDTNNNAADFIWNQTTSNPQNSSSPLIRCVAVTGVSSTTLDGTYVANDTIDITVTFNVPVNVTGFPSLLLETGLTDREAVYLSGSGSTVLVFRYVVMAGDASGDLDYVSSSALLLNGGTITGAVGDAVLTLPTPGASGSLGANRDIRIDNQQPPSVTVNQASTQSDPTGLFPINFRVEFSEPIDVATFTPSDITQNGTATGITWSITDSGDHRIFTLSATTVTGTNVTLIPSIAANQVTDPLGSSNTASTSTDNTVTFENTPPTVTITRATGQPATASGTPVFFTVSFSEPIIVSTFTVADITQSGTISPSLITWNITDSGDHTNFTLSATMVAGNGIIKPTMAANEVTDVAGNPNIASADVGANDEINYQDNVQPTVTINQASGQADPTSAFPLNFTVVFSEPIVASIFTPSDITQTGTATGITWSITNSGDNRTFTVSATAVTGEGTVRPIIQANRVTDIVGNINLASTSTDNSVTYVPIPTITPSPTRTPTRTRTPTPVRTATRTRTPPPPPPPPPLVAINEFVPRPGTDWNNDGVVNQGDEYIELLNHGVVPVNLSGYRLDDEANIGSNPFSLPSVTLQPGERIVFYGSQTALLLSDGGDGVRLLRPNGQLMDAYNYFVVYYPDQAFCRLPDNGGADDWNENCFPTPGLKNSLSGSVLRPPTREDVSQPLCPIADTLPEEFILAECSPFGNNIWNRLYWDRFGWYGEMPLLNVNLKWEVFAD